MLSNNNKLSLPTHLKAPVRVSAKVAYLLTYHHLPYNLIKTAVQDLSTINLDKGNIKNKIIVSCRSKR